MREGRLIRTPITPDNLRQVFDHWPQPSWPLDEHCGCVIIQLALRKKSADFEPFKTAYDSLSRKLQPLVFKYGFLISG